MLALLGKALIETFPGLKIVKQGDSCCPDLKNFFDFTVYLRTEERSKFVKFNILIILVNIAYVLDLMRCQILILRDFLECCMIN